MLSCISVQQTLGQQVQMALDTTTIAIGEPTVLRVIADRDVTAGTGSFDWPEWQDTIPGGLEILNTFVADTTAIEGVDGNPIIRVERAFQITAWDSGYLAIPPALLVWGADTVASNPLLLNVLLAAPGKSGQIAGHADIRRVQWTWQERLQRWLPWFLAVAVIIGGILFIVRRWRNRSVPAVEDVVPPPPLEPAHIVALRELDRIGKEAAWKRGQVKAHHAAVSEVLRTYFERRYNYPAMERSTDELRSGLGHLPIRTQEKELILELLQLTDLVKFAKWSPLPADHQRIVDKGIQFVEITTVASENAEG